MILILNAILLIGTSFTTGDVAGSRSGMFSRNFLFGHVWSHFCGEPQIPQVLVATARPWTEVSVLWSVASITAVCPIVAQIDYDLQLRRCNSEDAYKSYKYRFDHIEI